MNIRHLPAESNIDHRQHYYINLLKLALDKTRNSHGDYQLISLPKKMNQGRAVRELSLGQSLDVIWTMTSKLREEKLQPIRIPLLKGLLGYRVFIIRKGDKKRFSAVSNISDLKNFVFGQGHDWPDTHILRSNGLNVVTHYSYEGLFSMLSALRFDIFPRGIQEAYIEVAARPEFSITVEETLLLRYKAPIYFFVSRENVPLGNRIHIGLMKSIKDKSFDAIFNRHPDLEDILKSNNIKKRKVFDIKNPNLPELTPINNKALWYQ